MSGSEENNQSRGFKVEDRRRFTPEGESREEQPKVTPPPGQATLVNEPDAASRPQALINFTTFVISLGTQALAFLGEIPNPADGSTQADLVAAKEMIDIIAMLQEKTKGNLDDAEANLVNGFLYDLRLKYVESVKNARAKA